MTRLFSLLLVILLLAGCAGPTALPPAPTLPVPMATATPVRLVHASPAPTATPQQAAPEATRLPHMEAPLVWLLRAEPQPGLAMVNEALNRHLAERGFNARVELRLVDELHYERQVAELAASGALPDLLTTGGAAYDAGVASGWYHPITPEDAPWLWQSLPAAAWQAVRRSGKVYAVPAVGQWTIPYGAAIRVDVLAALGLDPLLPQVNTFSDLTALFETIQAGMDSRHLDPALRTVLGPVDLLRPEAAGYEPLAAHFVVRADDPQAQVLDWLQTPAALDLAKLRQAWAQAGYQPGRLPDPAGWLELCQAGRFAIVVGALGQPDRCGQAWVEKPLAPFFLSTAAISADLTAVGAKDPERARRALLLLEWVRAEPELYNLLSLGLEGRHWQWDAQQGLVSMLPEDPPGAGYRPEIDAQLGRPDLRYPSSMEEARLWPVLLAWNAQALVSPALGFRFDPQPAAGPLAAMRGLERELAGPLSAGQVRDADAALHRLDEQLDALGAPTVVSEIVRQFSYWRASP
jgi:putative aldouronate transport system substrate-binding protein